MSRAVARILDLGGGKTEMRGAVLKNLKYYNFRY